MDADRCVEVNPSWAKGYSRMGTALFRLGRHDKAAAAYSKGGWAWASSLFHDGVIFAIFVTRQQQLSCLALTHQRTAAAYSKGGLVWAVCLLQCLFATAVVSLAPAVPRTTCQGPGKDQKCGLKFDFMYTEK